MRGGAEGGKEIWTSIVARDRPSFTILYTNGVLLGCENKKACSAYLNHIAAVFPGQQVCLEQKWRNQARVVVVLLSERLYMLHA